MVTVITSSNSFLQQKSVLTASPRHGFGHYNAFSTPCAAGSLVLSITYIISLCK
jgi:hypothetical protein